MTGGETAFLALVIIGISVFAISLAAVTWVTEHDKK